MGPSISKSVFGKIQRRGHREILIIGWSYAAIARKLGYRDAPGAWRAVQRLRDQEAAWHNYEECTGHHPQTRHQPTERELEQAIEAIEQQIEAIKRYETLDDRRLTSAKRLLLRQTLVEMRRETRAK
jgi:hypothetical protein